MYISEVFSGRPEPGTATELEERCYALLDSLDIAFSRVEHDAAFSMEELFQAERTLEVRVCKNLFLTNRQQTEFYLLLMPGDKPFKTKYLSSQLGVSRLSFAGEEQLVRFLGVTHGSASILGLICDTESAVHLIIDSELKNEEFFACHPCKNTATLKMRTSDVLEKLLPALGREEFWVELPREVD